MLNQGCFCPGQGCCGQRGVLISVAAPWPVLVLLQATALGPWGSTPLGYFLSGDHRQTILRFPLGGPPVVPGWQKQPCQQLPCQGLLWHGYSGFSGRLVLERTPGVAPHKWQLVPWRWATGALCWLSKHMDQHAVSPNTCVIMYTNGPKQRDGNLLSSVDRSPNIIQAEPPGLCRVRAWGGVVSVPTSQSPFKSVRGSWSDPHVTVLKWACFQVAVALMSCPLVIIPIAQSVILDPALTRTFSE